MITVTDIAYVRLSAPDLDLMEQFLSDFGMQRTVRTTNALYMRGAGPDPVVHITELGEREQRGFALKVGSRDELIAASERFAVAIEARTEPGGGEVVKIKDPDGNRVELVHGLVGVTPELARVAFTFNAGTERNRHNKIVRTADRPSHIMRLGHIALHSTDFDNMMNFYCAEFGMKVSDSYYSESPDKMIGAFLHCGLGQTYVDHHTIALIEDGRTGFEHFAFEVLDLDDLLVGNKYLLAKGNWNHSWGIGRHNDGSQIFDYWRDPFGNKIEHWTDGDLVNDEYASKQTKLTPETAELELSQWGPKLPSDFFN